MKLKDFGKATLQKKIIEIWKKQGYRLSSKYYPQSMKGRMDRIRRIIDGFCHCDKFNTHLLK
ncbi:MAG: hypothetical protein WB501_09280 [Nitrososphaeraceae archaeon]